MLCQQRFTGFSFPSQCCVSCLSFFPSKPNNFFGKTFRYIILLVTLTKLIKRASRTINPSIFRCQRSAPIRRRTLHDTYFFRLISRNLLVFSNLSLLHCNNNHDFTILAQVRCVTCKAFNSTKTTLAALQQHELRSAHKLAALCLGWLGVAKAREAMLYICKGSTQQVSWG